MILGSYTSGRFDEWSKKKQMTLPRAGECELDGAINMTRKRFCHNKEEKAERVDTLDYDYG